MRASPLELLQTRFLEVSIKARPPAEGDAWPRPFNFDGVNFLQSVSVQHAELKKPVDRTFVARFKSVIDNDVGKPTPYDVTIEVAGIFSVHPKYEGDPEDLIFTAGCGVLWGAMREMVLTVTSRGANGELVLPTATFQDTRELATKHTASARQQKKPTSQANKASEPEEKLRNPAKRPRAKQAAKAP